MSEDPGLVQKTVHIVRAIAAHPNGIGLSDLSRETSISKATCHRILGALEREGWLVSNPDTRRFRLSLDLVFMLEGVKNEDSLADYTRIILRDLAATTRETAGLDRLAETSVVVLAEVPGPHLIGHAPRPVPRSLNAWRTSTGRALLAWGDPEPLRAAFDAESVMPPASRFASFDAFLTELETVRENGYAYTWNELEEGLAAVAAPVHVGGTVPYAVWISGPTYRIEFDALPDFAASVIESANQLGRMLEQGHTAPRVESVDLPAWS